jgi:ornithine carbamoyltransferase
MQALRAKHFLSVQDVSKNELSELIGLAIELKTGKIADCASLLRQKSLGMVFQKPSTRTRVSFEVGMTKLGGHALYLGANDLQLGRSETISDTARVLSRYMDGVMVRLFNHADAVEFAKHSSIPVINGLTDSHHPCQAVADVMTIHEKKGGVAQKTVTFIGNAGDNVCHSLMQAVTLLGGHMRVAAPKGYQPFDDVVLACQDNVKISGGSILVTDDVKTAAKGADVIYADTWVSMGQEGDKQKRLADLRAYQVTSDVMALGNRAIFMHDLPAYRGNEMTADVIDGSSSVVFDQAENRLWAQNALLVSLIGGKK